MRNIRTILLLCIITCLLLATAPSYAQTDSSKKDFNITAYAEVFYAYDFAKPQDHIRQPFLYAYNRHNTFSLHLGMIKANYDNDKVRGNLALMAGTYSNDNMAAEAGVLKNIYEANVGVKISKKENVWIDAGVLPSHIGWESAVGKDCPTLTRSIAAENSPYFETGARLSYTSHNNKWYIAGLLLNGWQRIERVNGNHTPAFGQQLTYKPNDQVTINSSSFIGNDKPDSIRQMRYFHDLYGQFSINESISLTLGFDIGAEQQSKGSSRYNIWYTPNVIASIRPDEKWNIGLRAEYFNDKNGVIIPGSNGAEGFRTFGYSMNVDRLITDNCIWRMEARGFNSKDRIFMKDGRATNSNFFVTSSLAISF
ncbi:porin [Haoranjiania flava]|uniref:Porin n=1 Tax=Haoranjiania flava TaxID=1856322 RepID=A0AAE3LMI0_9BACT|nr:porin [Haoranjiania flava]MCU7693896.1 porin [Haoranjiania flava]